MKVFDKISGAEDGVTCAIVGTLIKEMPLVTRVLDDFTKDKVITPIPPNQNLVSPKDNLVLEDEEGRISLVADRSLVDSLVTGLVIAVKGRAAGGGREFEVEEVCYPGLASQPSLTKMSEQGRYVALISGIRVGDTNQNPLALQLFADYVTGHVGSLQEEEFASQIVRVIVAGNSLVAPEKMPEGSGLKHVKKAISQENQKKLIGPLQELDSLLSQLSQSVNVDILPGENDPSHYVIPQQPFARCLLPNSFKFTTFRTVTNPYECEIDGRLFLGTSGQTMQNMERLMICNDMSALAESTLQWRHLAPTAPDQLGCYPFYEQDPFIIERTPHVYFIGNQKEFQTKLIEGPSGQKVRLILLPAFADKPTIVLLNLHDLNVHPISFNVNL